MSYDLDYDFNNHLNYGHVNDVNYHLDDNLVQDPNYDFDYVSFSEYDKKN